MTDSQVSIGQVKRDISELVNRVAFGNERVLLTSRGKPKAAIVSMDDYRRLTVNNGQQERSRVETWLAASDQLANRILAQRNTQAIDVDVILEAAKTDLDERYDFQRSD